jgi:hypothetical protein
MRRMKRAIKRVPFYLVLGFVMSWLVAWGLAMLPRVTLPGFMSESRMYAAEQQGNQDDVIAIERDPAQSPFPIQKMVYLPEEALLRITDTRWIGAQEVSFSIAGYSSSTTADGMSIGFLLRPWWTLTAKNEQRFYGRGQWNIFKQEFHNDSPGFDMSRYSILRYGFPFMSHEARVVYLPNTSATSSRNESRAFGALVRDMPSRSISPFSLHSVLNPFARWVYLPYSPLWQGLLYNTLFYALIFFTLISTKRAFRHARWLRKGKCPICSYDLQFDNTLGCPECGWRKGSEVSA